MINIQSLTNSSILFQGSDVGVKIFYNRRIIHILLSDFIGFMYKMCSFALLISG